MVFRILQWLSIGPLRLQEMQPHRIFESFFESLLASVDAADLRRTMSAASAALDLRTYAYLSLPPKPADKPILISNYPSSWTSHYLLRQYEQIRLHG
ncbi:autoinducer binding domain-containing protein [Chelativorans xinjiangense]|uniref:autoinducer binding domain-containing protein n=1 Tax=Chelativorans xinjiangense TaxID=2681485 RepID=UPI00135688F2